MSRRPCYALFYGGYPQQAMHFSALQKVIRTPCLTAHLAEPALAERLSHKSVTVAYSCGTFVKCPTCEMLTTPHRQRSLLRPTLWR